MGFFRRLPLEEKLVEAIEASGFDGPIIIQCFEEPSLRIMESLRPQWKRVKLLTEPEVPLDDQPDGQRRLLDKVADYAHGIGPCKVMFDPCYAVVKIILHS